MRLSIPIRTHIVIFRIVQFSGFRIKKHSKISQTYRLVPSWIFKYDGLFKSSFINVLDISILKRLTLLYIRLKTLQTNLFWIGPLFHVTPIQILSLNNGLSIKTLKSNSCVKFLLNWSIMSWDPLHIFSVNEGLGHNFWDLLMKFSKLYSIHYFIRSYV